MLTLDELTQAVADGSIDTVIVGFTDMQGRLLGKRLHGEFFVEEHVGAHGVEACNYLLALDMEMDTVPGYRMARRRRSSSATSCGTTASRWHRRRGRS